ncbi:hypothetical protein [Pseudarthrobacter sp. fls2-241-R2A-168]|uniref:hypothetical protein n=1 Tax=Pseudarthrobacter sp. fls2-241-R2A-168 TaxID=3040304 RepID=UPI00255387DE|nr:hypothetical protein [Pseudarthrobacter sp. fls2-241-R2A-168]
MSMTVGQLLLDNLWNDAAMLEAFNKWGGVSMAIIGALLAVPQAVRHLLHPVVTVARKTWQAVASKLGRTKSANVELSGIGSAFAMGHPPTVTTTSAWPANGSTEEQHDWIRGELRRVEDRFVGQFENNEKVIGGLRSELRDLSNRVFQTIADLQRQLDNKERETVQIDGNGLRPIVSGIVLTGIPEELSRWGFWGWLIFGIACGFTIYAFFKSLENGVWTTHP